MNLFNEPSPEIIRTIGFYQPYCSLMLHGKIETRWVRAGKKAPFPLSKYIGYSTKKAATRDQILEWSGEYISMRIKQTLANSGSADLNGYALWQGDLVKVAPASVCGDVPETKTFVTGPDTKLVIDKDGNKVWYDRWLLFFDNVEYIKAFEWKYGKQGVGFVPQEELKNIEIIAKLDAKKLQIPDQFPQLIHKT